MPLEIGERWKEIVDGLYTDVIITDKEGVIVYANESTEYWFNMEKRDIIGNSVFELEKKKIFYPSVARMVLESGQKQTLIQQTRNDKKLLVTGNIIYDSKQNIEYIVCYSQDITEIEKLKSYIKKVEGELESIKKELQFYQKLQMEDSRLVAKSPKMQKVLSVMDRVADTDATVLLTGESGVGKSLLAEQLHKKSNRKGEFVAINCSSIPESLIESELFGYKPGAFTGASQKGKVGLVEKAQNGTLFLDEIGELPINVQAKLLMLIQEKTFYRIGDSQPREVNFRLVAATNVNLEELIKQGAFRKDLYFRLSVIHISIPPLRERQEDLLNLLMNMTERFNKRYDRHKELTHETIDCLLRYSWPGNVRELSNIVERLVLTIEEDVLLPEHLPENINTGHLAAPLIGIGHKSLKEIVEETEIRVLKDARKKYISTTKMAKILKVSQPTIVRKLKKYGL
ncbi:MAG TPA: PAS domain-containing protein [Bacillus bacterium]|uniref:HTH-type transcriptional regulatory protein TyrR n=1 Tax=Siminovitchia fordii TaxID=254759 RepID=A0ABQ4K980_9BACI|nr:sigma 54-interacting transcriptional regulator [Siminovitchia fordii]GIN22270.1 RNA polymerase subunit sigma-54 [Siminovitchia fordii]HBZ10748.1 PAS domain-containing protein [Bacillus sp. (in: firmicutes)]